MKENKIYAMDIKEYENKMKDKNLFNKLFIIPLIKNALFLIGFVLFILLLGLASAIYAGESTTIQNTLGIDNLNWLIVDNTSIISVLPLVTINSNNITIQIPSNMPPNSFKIIFLEETTNTIVQTVQVSSGSGGGHSSSHSNTIIKYVNQTKEVEVPTYISVPNETIKLVENKTIETKYVNVGEVKILNVILGLLLVALIIGVLIYFMNRKNNQDNREGGNEDGRNKTEEELF
jgi:hypothetical protein